VAKVVSVVQKAGSQLSEKIPEGWWVEVFTKAAKEKVDSSFRRMLSVKGKASRKLTSIERENDKRPRIDPESS
jgi:hypothetical protein